MTNDKKIVLFARLKVKREAVEAAKLAALEIVESSRDEAGCLNYDFHQAVDDETIFIWHETWKDEAAIKLHGKSKHFNDFSKRLENLIEEPLQITLTKMISEKAREKKY